MPRGIFIRTEEHNRKNSEAQKGKPKSEEHRRKIREAMNGLKRSEETRRKNSESHKGKILGEKNYNWKGGVSRSYHEKVKKLYGKNYCEMCGISRLLNFKIRNTDLHMHCVDRNYKNLNPLNWPTLCPLCHSQQHPRKGLESKKTGRSLKRMVQYSDHTLNHEILAINTSQRSFTE